jgi:hypothetical protein
MSTSHKKELKQSKKTTSDEKQDEEPETSTNQQIKTEVELHSQEIYDMKSMLGMLMENQAAQAQASQRSQETLESLKNLVEVQVETAAVPRQQARSIPKSQDVRQQARQLDNEFGEQAFSRTPMPGTSEQYFQAGLLTEPMLKSSTDQLNIKFENEIEEQRNVNKNSLGHSTYKKRMSGASSTIAQQEIYKLQQNEQNNIDMEKISHSQMNKFLAARKDDLTDEAFKYLNAQRAAGLAPERMTFLEFQKSRNSILSSLDPHRINHYLEGCDTFAKKGGHYLEEMNTNWLKTIRVEGIMSKMFEHNYKHSNSDIGNERIVVGRIFSYSTTDDLQADDKIVQGFELRLTETKLDQLNFSALCMWLKLFATPVNFKEYQETFNKTIEFTNELTPFNLNSLALTDAHNVHLHWSQTFRFLDTLASTQKKLLASMQESSHKHPGDPDYFEVVNLRWSDRMGLRHMFDRIVKEFGSPWLIQWIHNRDTELAQVQKPQKATRVAKQEFPDKPQTVKPPPFAESLLEEVHNVIQDYKKLQRVGDSVRHYEELLKKDAPEVYNFRGGKQRLTVLEEEPSGGPTELEEDYLLCQSVQHHDNELCAFPQKTLYSPGSKYKSSRDPRVKKDFCYHRILGIPCKDECPGKGNEDMTDGWYSAVKLLHQSTEAQDRATERGTQINRWLDKWEGMMRNAAPPVRYPQSRAYKEPNVKEEDNRRRDPPPKPYGDRLVRGPTREQERMKLLKKNQYSEKLTPQLRVLSDSEYEQHLRAAIEDPRFSHYASIDDEDEEQPGQSDVARRI